jgi:hypothetical protein
MMFCEGGMMKDMKSQLEKLLTEASECALIASLATDKAKRDLFARLAEHYGVLASEVKKAIAEATVPKT